MKRGKKLARVHWKNVSNEFFKSIIGLPREKICKAIYERTGVMPTWNAVLLQLNNRNISYPRILLISKLSSEEKEEYTKRYPEEAGYTTAEVDEAVKKSFPSGLTESQRYQIARALGLAGRRKNLRGAASTLGARSAEKSKAVVEIISGTELLENLPLEDRKWDDPEVLDITEEQWSKAGTRIGLISGIAFLNEGQRCGLILRGFHDLANEPTRFNVSVGHLVDKAGFQNKIKERTEEAKAHLKEEGKTKKFAKISDNTLKEEVISQLVDETAKALAALIPKIRKPKSQWRKDGGKLIQTFVRLYIATSQSYDGPYGERVAQRLRELREDIRLNDSDQMEIKEVNKILGVLVPSSSKTRMPSKYYSTAAEREIDDKEGKTIKDFPDFWVVGPFAASVFTPNGVRERPYAMVPALRKLEEVRIAENQVGIMALNFESKEKGDLPIVSLWSYGDLIKKEHSFIDPPRGATRIQEKIVKILQERGGQSVGQIVDHIGEDVTREKISEEIKDLVEPKMTNLKTWPGIDYNPQSQKYNFHLRWIQEKLKYPEIKNLAEDSMLFFGCLHAGYTTSDTEHFVREVPKIILERNVGRLFGLGDMIAGLHHDFGHTGEVFGSMNYTEQEYFAAEILATVLLKVFSSRFGEFTKHSGIKGFSPEDLSKMVKKSLVQFDFICGNHDLWQEGDGHTPLAIFHSRLVELLTHYIGKIFAEQKVHFFDLFNTIKECIALHPDYNAHVTLPSGIKVAMEHPHMGNSQTTSLRAQSAMALMESQVTAIANFHSSTLVPKWRPDLGQCITVQVGTQAIYTRFERRKMKRAVGFGPVLLKTFSHNSRIIKLEESCYNKPYLKEAISKSTDPVQLKKKLGIVT